MRKFQTRLTVAVLFTTLAIIAFFVTAFVSGPISFLYRDAAGLSSARNIAQIVSLLALVVLFVAGLIITVPLALQPASWPGKIGKVLPVYLLLFGLVAVVSALIGVGQVGNLFNIQGVGSVTFVAAWLGLAAIISTIAVAVAAASAKLSVSTLKNATRTTVAASALTSVAAIAMIASMVIISTSQPSTFGGGGGGGFPGGPQGGNRPGAGGQTTPGQNGGNRPNGQAGQGQQPEATGEALAGAPNGQNGGAAPAGAGGQGQRPEGTGEPQPQGGAPGGQNGGAPGGFPPGGGPGGSGGGGSANIAGRYAVGGALMTIFAVIGLIGGVSALSALRQVPTTAWMQPVNYPRQAGLALLTGIGITIILVGAIQLIPVTRDNPPVKTPINWDSEQTKKLVYATCMDCHSNETTWPWYASVAPSSWLTTMHVHDGRAQMNLSEMDSMPSFQRQGLAENMANQIQSGSMPPKDYLILHPDARLTDAEKEQLIQGLQKSLGGS